jgi:hypothetical protein
MSHSNVSPERENLFLGFAFLIVTDVHLLKIKTYRLTYKCDVRKCTPLEAILCITLHTIDKEEVSGTPQ